MNIKQEPDFFDIFANHDDFSILNEDLPKIPKFKKKNKKINLNKTSSNNREAYLRKIKEQMRK